MFYFLFLFTYICGIHYYTSKRSGNGIWVWIISFIPLFLYGALRINCGDYEIYENYNTWVHTSNDVFGVIERMEPGYALLNSFLSYRAIIVLFSLLGCISYAYFIKTYVQRQYWWFALVVYFLVCDKTMYFMFASIRNAIAIDLLLIYISTLSNDKKKGFKSIVRLIIFTLLSASFHTSSLLFYPIAYILYNPKTITRKESIIWYVVLALLLVIPVDLLLERIPLLQVDAFERYEDYVEETRDAGLLAKFGATIFAVLVLQNNVERKYSKTENSISRLMLVFVYSYLLGSLNVRVSHYFIPFAIVYLSCVYGRKKDFLTNALIIYALLFMFYSTFIAGTLGDPIRSPLVNYKIMIQIF